MKPDTYLNPIIILFISLFLPFVYGCEDYSSGPVGEEVVKGPLNVVRIDTVTVHTTTVFMDSVETQNTGMLISGQYNDSIFGLINSDAYMRLGIKQGLVVTEDASLDSLRFMSRINYRYGRDEQPLEVTLYRVIEDIEPPEDRDSEVLYNFDHFTYDPSPLGQTTILPDENDSLNFRLEDQLGVDILKASKDEEDFIIYPAEFNDYLKGMVLVGRGTENNSIVGLSADSSGAIILRLFYSDIENGERVSKHFDIQANPGISFSAIRSQREAPLDKLQKSRDTISGSNSDYQGYVEGGVGIMSRVDIPYLEELKQLAPIVDIVSAKLKVFPVKDSYGEYEPLPRQIVTHIADEYNNVIGTLSDNQGRPIYSRVKNDSEFNEHVYYSVDITSFVLDEFNKDRYTERGLLLSLPENKYRTTLSRLVFGNEDHEEYQMYLQIDLTLLNYE